MRTVDHAARRVGVVDWEEQDGVSSMIADTCRVLGCRRVVRFRGDARVPEDLDVVVAHGPLGSLVPLLNHLLEMTRSERPALVLWMTEQLPDPGLPEWLRYGVGQIRSGVERWVYRWRGQGEGRLDRRRGWITSRMHRFRYYGDLYWLSQADLRFVLAVGSRWVARYLRERGFDPIEAYIGFHSDWGEDLGLERDVPVLWIGKVATRRRERLLKRIGEALRSRGIGLLRIDGQENPYVFGEERTRLLNRTRVVLNLVREEWDNNAFRFYLAAANRALIITEPILPHTPFQSGVHLVQSTVEGMADAVGYYLTHETERREMVERAYELVTSELRMTDSVCRILGKAAATS